MDITFAELPLGSKLQAAITAAGYTVPTPIQAQAIPVAVTGRDVLGIAQTGTGKTASFVLPMIQRLEEGRARARMPRSLILAPTRELAAQVAQSFEKYGVNHKLDVALLIGGVSMDDQVKKLDRGVDVLIATPGRLLDHFQRGRIMLMGAEILVIDEADRMLDMGFIPDIEKICKLLPPKRQTLFFSATMPNEIKRLVDTFLKDPVRIEVARPATTAKTIKQLFRFCPSTEDFEKRELLRELIQSHPVKNAIIFCNRKRDVAILHKSLVKHGFNAGALHGDMDQKARTETLDKFRNGEIMLLAASDVAARGLDIPDVSHIFNFDIPWAGDDYVHRIGRTGRAGKEGTSVSLVTPEDLKLIKDIEKVTGELPTWIGEPPTDADFADGGKRRGRGRGAARGPERGAARGAERGATRGAERAAAGGPERAGARGPERGAARGEGRGAARAEVRGGARRTERAPGRRTTGDDARPEGGSETRAEGRSSSGRLPGRRSQESNPGNDVPAELIAAPLAGDAIDGGKVPEQGARPQEPRHEPKRDARRDSGREPGRDSGREPRREARQDTRREPAHEARRGGGQQSIPGTGDQPFVEPARRQAEGASPTGGERQDRVGAERGRDRGADRSGGDRPVRRERQPERATADYGDRVERPVREPRPRKPEPAGSGVGFADNVPAFLRRPVRPVKVANE